jgi:hypothetical protein
LKQRINAANDEHNLFRLVFHDIKQQSHRDAIIAHLRREMLSDNGSDARAGAGTGAALRVLVVAEDDSITRSPAADPRFTVGTVYPGLAAFLAEVQSVANGSGRRIAKPRANGGSNFVRCNSLVDFGQFHLLYPQHTFIFIANAHSTFAAKMLAKCAGPVLCCAVPLCASGRAAMVPAAYLTVCCPTVGLRHE